ncbi:MAP/microtubule affinity-regulating kinase 3 [Myotis brandtii]|uniref:non-specific serine/threonine protein kinase n=1 Tax=Myotis brandtii TaxID=109478 RepID=S7MY76_MYOBR|nr:MAP/microtubule affinity-regulating kinase 3 [Myotis brandtii]
MEHLSGGNISDYLEDHYRMTEKEARSIFHQLVSPVQHSHQKGIVHRDLSQRTCSLMLRGTSKLWTRSPIVGLHLPQHHWRGQRSGGWADMF